MPTAVPTTFWSARFELAAGSVQFFDTDGDTIVTFAELRSFDTDDDNQITFVDLNDPAFTLNAPGQCLDGLAPLDCDRDGDGSVTPLDLVDGLPGLVGFEAGFDNDNNGFDDDLVGLDFLDDDNPVAEPTPGTSCISCSGHADGLGNMGGIVKIVRPSSSSWATCAESSRS